MKLWPVVKFWLETEEGYVFGEGPFGLLRAVGQRGTIRGAAEELGMSYRHAWGILRKLERKVGVPMVKTRKGGASGGGGAVLTTEALQLMLKYEQIRQALTSAMHSLDEPPKIP